PVNTPVLEVLTITRLVEAVAQRVEHVPLDLRTDRYRDGTTGVGHRHTAHQPVSGLHRDRADLVLSQVLRDLEGHLLGKVGKVDVNVQCLVQRRNGTARKLHVHDRTGRTDHAPGRGTRVVGTLGVVVCGDSHLVITSCSGERLNAADDLADLLGDLR